LTANSKNHTELQTKVAQRNLWVEDKAKSKWNEKTCQFSARELLEDKAKLQWNEGAC